MLWVDHHIGRQADSRVYTKASQVPPREVALVLGARVYASGELSAMLYDRVASAVELYKAGKVNKLLMSGDNRERHYDEVTAMRRVALEMGVKSDDVVRDFAGFRTRDSLYRAREIWGLRSLVIVTQRFHLPRSIYTARGLGIDAVGLVADKRDYTAAAYWRSRLREIISRNIAFLEVHVLHTKPHFLGAREDLSGDRQEKLEQQKPWRQGLSQSEAKK